MSTPASQRDLRFGPYIATAPIGRGGMGLVYRARHASSGLEVALKTLRAPAVELAAAFRREVQVLAQLEHPGIVRIIEHDFAGDAPWYAMELVEGRSLAALLCGERPARDGDRSGTHERTHAATLALDPAPTPVLPPLAPAPARPSYFSTDRAGVIRLMRRICEALAFLHERGLVHRDLKPENVLLRPDGEPVLVDFGLAAFGGQLGREVLDFADLGGTFAYMAPEQKLGHFVDARADLFSLGCMLYECMTGEPPFGPLGARDCEVAAPRPSAVVRDLPDELDTLVVRLLAGDPRERLGYAADVHQVLSRFVASETRVAAAASATYLYRPDFAGRKSVLARLEGALSAAKHGRGAFALVTGESGAGKTRLGLELAARAADKRMLVVTGECFPVGTQGGAFGAPLHPLRGFFAAVTDECRARGAEFAKRLLGARGAVLAPYERSFGELSKQTPPLETLPADAARERVFTALEELVREFARVQPILFVIDDLQWADELSLEFLGKLVARVDDVPLLLVGTYRVEESNERLQALAAAPGVLREELERLDLPAVERMVGGMLALSRPPAALVQFLTDEAGGNPFFVAEYLRVAVAEGVLSRDFEGRWTVRSADGLRDRLSLPPTIGALIERRLKDLDVAALGALEAAAVLGRGFDADLVARTLATDLKTVLRACATLRERQILEDDGAWGVRFVHDKLREIAYARIVPAELSRLHARAADALEARFADELDTQLGALGYHHGRAGAASRSAGFFERAGDHARKNYANADAARFYRLALEQVALAGEAEGSEATSRLHEALGEMLFLQGQYAEARLAFTTSHGATPLTRPFERVRRRRRLARTWEREHRHAEALAEYALAEAELGDVAPASAADEGSYWHERVQLGVDKAWDLYWLARTEELAALVARVRPLVEARGHPRQRAQFFQALVHMNLRRDRYAIADDTLEHARACLAAAELGAEPSELALAEFFVAFPLMFKGREAEAEPHFLAALAGAERVGDTLLLTRALSYYTILHRRLGRLREAAETAERAGRVAASRTMFDYLGASHANLCWVAWREQRPADVERHAEEALAAWQRLPSAYPYPFQWYLRLPYGAYLAERGDFAAAVEQWQCLRGKSQQALPPALDDALGVICTAYAAGSHASLADLARRAVTCAMEQRFL